MQGEELRRGQHKLEASRDRYVQLFDFAPVSYLNLSKNGLIVEANIFNRWPLTVRFRKKPSLMQPTASFTMPTALGETGGKASDQPKAKLES